MNLLTAAWLPIDSGRRIAATQIGEARWHDLCTSRPDFRGALYQLLIGLLQTAYAPRDVREWRERWSGPPAVAELQAAFAPYLDAFLLQSDGPAFMQDLELPADANQLPVLDLLIDAGSDSNRFFNRPAADHGMCLPCFAQALLTLQLNAPAGGRGVRTSLRGGGPLTTLLLPADDAATLWQKLWLNVLPSDALAHPPVERIGDVLPWIVPTRTSDGSGAVEAQPQLEPTRGPHHVHPLQAYWSMPRRIRLDAETVDVGVCSLCGAQGVERIRHYRTRHGGTNYTGNWQHPLTPYTLDPNGQTPPNSVKGRQAAQGYRNWLGLVLGSSDHRPDAARVVGHFNARVKQPAVRLWCFGYDVDKMKALCWYDSTLPVHNIEPGALRAFTSRVKQILDHANEAASALRKQVKAARFAASGDKASGPIVQHSFWQHSERLFYAFLENLSRSDQEDEAAIATLYRRWLSQTRRLVLSLFDEWTGSIPAEMLDLKRVVTARAALEKELNVGKCAKPLWDVVNTNLKEPA